VAATCSVVFDDGVTAGHVDGVAATTLKRGGIEVGVEDLFSRPQPVQAGKSCRSAILVRQRNRAMWQYFAAGKV
jgi:hypothetical protein